jgi:hypothetical protein
MGSALIDFLITLIGLIFVGAIIFMAIDFISTDERFKKIGKFAVGGIIVILFLFAIKGVLFGGGGAGLITPLGMLYFAISVIVILVVWFIIDWFLGWVGGFFPPIGQFMAVIKFVVAACVLIAILVAAADLLVGGSSGAGHFFSNSRGEAPAQNRDLLGSR